IVGDDIFNVNSFAGIADLTTVNLNGLDGSDTFNITPAATVAINANGHQPILPTAPGDTLNYVSAGNSTTNSTGVGNGTITQAGFQNVTYTSIETKQNSGGGLA